MKRIFYLFLLGIVWGAYPQNLTAQSVAHQRCASLGKGMNLSNWLEEYWSANWPNPNRYHQSDLQQMKDAGFESIRLPIGFSLISDTLYPYAVDTTSPAFALIDSVINWCNTLGLKLILDNHHGWVLNDQNWRLQQPRFAHLWAVVSKRYAHLDPNRFFFELLNEPPILGLEQDSLNALFLTAIDSIRTYAPNHSIIVSPILGSAGYSYTGYQPLADTNLIYTWHCYDPINFTHQGLAWSNPYSPPGTPYPDPNNFIEQLLYTGWDVVIRWRDQYQRPVFLGEFGISKPTYPEHRCNWINYMGAQIRYNQVSWFYWDWQYDFSMFNSSVIHPDSIIPCMRQALQLYGDTSMNGTGIIPSADRKGLSISPNPVKAGTLVQLGLEKEISGWLIWRNGNGQLLSKEKIGEASVLKAPGMAGFYLMELQTTSGIYRQKILVIP